MTKYELTVTYISSLKANINAKNAKIKYCEAKIKYIEQHPEEFYTGYDLVQSLARIINSLKFNINELEAELFLTQQKLGELLPNRGDVKDELEDHKTVSEE